MAESQVLKGTWEELVAHSEAFRGKKLRLTIIDEENATNGDAPPRNLAEFLGNFIGSVEGSGANNSEVTGAKYTEHLIKKQQEGHL